jgi:hypothetical protein
MEDFSLILERTRNPRDAGLLSLRPRAPGGARAAAPRAPRSWPLMSAPGAAGSSAPAKFAGIPPL